MMAARVPFCQIRDVTQQVSVPLPDRLCGHEKTPSDNKPSFNLCGTDASREVGGEALGFREAFLGAVNRSDESLGTGLKE